jgi:dipeptidyl aminopeptidase/acylaminoacyl peptidase
MDIKSYGSWASPITAEALADAQITFGNLRNGNGRLYWTENVPAAGGAIGLFRMSDAAAAARVVPDGANVRTRVHEYGGAPYAVIGETVFYVELADQRLYRLEPGGTPQALTPPGFRYADITPQRVRDGAAVALICVREDHSRADAVRNALVRIPLPAGGAGAVLYGESDFVAHPRVSPDGQHLAFVTWSHPHMPWDASELRVAELVDRGLAAVRRIAGGDGESVLEPEWDADGTLCFISDRSGFWNLYAWRGGAGEPLWPKAADFAHPLWLLGQASYALLGNGRVAARFGEGGLDKLAIMDLRGGTGRVLDLPYVEFAQLTRIDAHHVATIAGAPRDPDAIVRINVDTGEARVLRQAGRPLLEPNAISPAIPIEYPSAAGRVGHAFYYAPVNPRFRAPAGELPPLLTLVHGGPTVQASPGYSAAVQFWTSRGFAVVDVNYGGSSGFGRAYRQALERNWGVVDAEDVIAACRHLVHTGRVDPQRTAIRGGSAGGYTVLVALSTSDVFRAGADYYGISDMTAIARDTHKFESRYLDSLIGPLPQAQAIYDSRSPLRHLEGFKAPLIVFQGADDPVVPPNQSERIVAALRARGAPVAYLLYPGEGHGFRKPATTISSLQAELSFYGQVFGFVPADVLPPLEIENIHASPGDCPRRRRF